MLALRLHSLSLVPLSAEVTDELSPFLDSSWLIPYAPRHATAILDGHQNAAINLLFEFLCVGRIGCRAGVWNGWGSDVFEGKEKLVLQRIRDGFFERHRASFIIRDFKA